MTKAHFVSSTVRPLCERFRDLKRLVDACGWEEMAQEFSSPAEEIDEQRTDQVQNLTAGEVSAIMSALIQAISAYNVDIEGACVREPLALDEPANANAPAWPVEEPQ